MTLKATIPVDNIGLKGSADKALPKIRSVLLPEAYVEFRGIATDATHTHNAKENFSILHCSGRAVFIYCCPVAAAANYLITQR